MWAPVLLALLLAGCAAIPTGRYRDTSVPISSAAAFDAARYQGRWYEIARFPVPFEEGCGNVTADYALRPDGTLSVVNTCHEDDGTTRRITGTATPDGPGRLQVRLGAMPFAAPYWVLWVDEGYRTAVVGTPSGTAGWILNRTSEIPADRWQAAIEVLRFNGYDTGRLIRTPQT